jgi:hypothetical protein
MEHSAGSAARSEGTSPVARARLAGGLYAIYVAGCMFAQPIVHGMLVVPGNAAATAERIATRGALFQFAMATELFAVICFVAAALLLYGLLRPVNRGLALLALLAAVAESAIQCVSLLIQFVPSILLGAGNAVLPADQLQALAYGSFGIGGYGFNIYLVLFGVWFVATGQLVLRSGFLPRFLGVLLWVAGLCCLIDGFVCLFVPSMVGTTIIYLLAPFGLARFVLAGWLIAVGVNAREWRKMASLRGEN